MVWFHLLPVAGPQDLPVDGNYPQRFSICLFPLLSLDIM